MLALIRLLRRKIEVKSGNAFGSYCLRQRLSLEIGVIKRITDKQSTRIESFPYDVTFSLIDL